MASDGGQGLKSALGQLAGVVSALHAQWTPHKGQIRVGRALFNDNRRRLFVQCGRKWGKSEFLIYTLVRWAAVNPNSACYYFAPFQKQAREILWQRLLQFVPRAFYNAEAGINKTEGRITLLNGSFIKLDGSDNFEAYRGVTPDIVAYDEFKDFRPEFHVAMEPNLAPKNAPLLIVGTPPDVEGQYTELAEEIRADSRDGFWIEAPSSENPHIPSDWLEKTRTKLIARGEPDTWEREYMGRFVKGGARSIFPMFNSALHTVEPERLRRELRDDLHKLEWYLAADPGTTTTFAALILAIHPYTRKVYVFDEIYEQDTKNTTTGRIWPLMRDKMALANPNALPDSDTWYRVYDEAAAWFAAEVLDRYNVQFVPTAKAAAAKETGLGLIKDLMTSRAIVISRACEKLIWEVESYMLDANGRIPKKNDHLIDALRYALHAASYSAVELKEPKQKAKDEMRRAYTLKEDLANMFGDKYNMPDDDY